MKIKLKDLDISETDGFDEQKDIFERKGFGERLANLIENSEENLVISLHAPWGEGKSTFIKMWKSHVEHIRETPLKAIYFDAFANDYQKDPFLALATEIYALLKDESDDKRKKFKEKAGKAVKGLIRGSLKIGVKFATGGVVDGSIIDSAENDISKLVSDQVDQLISDRFENATKDKMALTHFREYLTELAGEIGNGKPIVFVIDELDRCRPDFALELIEQIKHLFSVPNITFLLVMNREQIEESIRAKYGQGINATQYLQKFIDLWVGLPREDDYLKYSDVFIDHALKQMELSVTRGNESVRQQIKNKSPIFFYRLGYVSSHKTF